MFLDRLKNLFTKKTAAIEQDAGLSLAMPEHGMDTVVMPSVQPAQPLESKSRYGDLTGMPAQAKVGGAGDGIDVSGEAQDLIAMPLLGRRTLAQHQR